LTDVSEVLISTIIVAIDPMKEAVSISKALEIVYQITGATSQKTDIFTPDNS
jgi:hypothetical protein